jgi:hypothetical protein
MTQLTFLFLFLAAAAMCQQPAGHSILQEVFGFVEETMRMPRLWKY